MEALTILLLPKKNIINHAVYYLIIAYLYIASNSLFKYLVSCFSTTASYYASIPLLALFTNFPLPLHKTLVCFPNADMTHYYSACSEASSNDRLLDSTEAHSCPQPLFGSLLAPTNINKHHWSPLPASICCKYVGYLHGLV